ncbi:MAG: ribonuclease Z [Cytophagales bacterium]|uniref:Ribonuclease Z n=1 Tax=Algoriphagus taiwanensis TaxID=1445656 RepID=A0ABQ6Q617_9BACT|nr:MAG: ribonuclease Z [Cytophagales bacterium]GMQ35020.1 ribonuclease Z [Algoriphagus taiwanensis]
MIPDFEVTILGNTSSIPVHGRNHTAQVVRFGQEFLMLDCGEGAQIQLRKYKIKSSRISHIFISHLHGDHYLGLVGLLSSYQLSKRTKPLRVFGPKGLDEIITTHFRWSNTQIDYPLEFVVTQTDGMHLLLDHPRFQVYSFPLVHRLPTTGFLIREKEGLRNLIKEKLQEKRLPLQAIHEIRQGRDFTDPSGEKYCVDEYAHPLPPLRSYAFCSDTRFEPGLVEFIAGVDLLYHESTFTEADAKRAQETFHSTGKQAAEIARISGAKSLLLGHFSSRYGNLDEMLAEAQTIFPGSVLSREGDTYSIQPFYEQD